MKLLQPLLLAALTLSAAPSPPLAAQEGAPAFAEALEVTLVNLDVFVTDRRGVPVTDLRREDFTVTDDDRPVEITHFAPPSAARLSPEPGASQEQAGVPAAEPALPPEPLQLAVLIDNVNTRPQNRSRVMDQLRAFLAGHLPAGDLVLVASFDGAVQVQQAFTADRGLVEAALARVEGLPAQGVEVEIDRRSGGLAMQAVMLEENQENRTACAALFEEAVNAYLQGSAPRVSATLAGLESFVGALGGLPGRKALLWVSDGVEIRPPDSLVDAAGARCADASLSVRAQRFDRSEFFRRLAAVANAARVTFYPLDAAGVGGGESSLRDRQATQDSFALVAQETGGKALLNAGDAIEALAAAAAEMGAYYSLAYRPEGGAAGQLRRIEVELKRRGLKVQHRRSYTLTSDEETLRHRLLAALWLGGAENPLGLSLEAQGEPRAEADGFHLDLLLGIPIAGLALRPGEGGVQEGRFTVHVTHLAADGTIPALRGETKSLRIPAGRLAEASRQLFGYKIAMVLPAGESQVAVAVRDEVGRTLSLVTRRERLAAP